MANRPTSTLRSLRCGAGGRCAFNEGGVSLIYPVRPIACRNAHALDSNAHCARSAQGKPPGAVDFVPLSRFLTKAKRLLHAAHNAISPPAQRHQQEACAWVSTVGKSKPSDGDDGRSGDGRD